MNLISATVVIIIYIIICAECYTHSKRKHPKHEHKRIINGDEVSIKEYPFALAYISFSSTREDLCCAASIIQKNYAITNAVCLTVMQFTASFDQVLRGNTSFIKGPDASNHWVIGMFRHPEYFHEESNMNDIGLLQVREPFIGVNEVPIPLAPPDYQYKVGSMVRILGWGYADTALTRPSMVLRAADVRVIHTTRCTDIYTSYNYYNNGLLYIHTSDNKTFCAIALNSGDCAGDSGGAVIQNGKLIGIISARVGCGSERFPSVFVKVSAFLDWIQEVMNNSNANKNV